MAEGICIHCNAVVSDARDGVGTCARCAGQIADGVEEELVGGCEECRRTAYELSTGGHAVECPEHV